MSLSLCILASGSGGNCAVLRCDDGGALLVDAGLSPRSTARRMDGTGVRLEAVEAICLTHLDFDHFHRGWIKQIVKQSIRVYCGPRHADELFALGGEELAPFIHAIDGQLFEPVRGVVCSAIAFRHDDAGSHGFEFSCGETRFAYATDLGRVPRELIEHFAGVDVLCLESNYDVKMQIQSSRPQFLKNRIMNGRGHLSNHEAYDAIRRIFDRSHAVFGKLPSHVVLLHRSRECNCPKLLREFFHRDRRFVDRLVLAEQHERSEWLSPTPRPRLIGEQLMLAW
jgi:phosphoribosyl 1,2-cyclic phosphodiesterase